MKNVPALEFRNVSYADGQNYILKSINWTVHKDEHWAVLGPNGAGKTTLLRIACGYLWPNYGGTVYRKGRKMVDLRTLRQSIGWVTSSLPPSIPPREKSIRTVVSGKFAQIGLLEGSWGTATYRDYTRAESYLTQMGCYHLMNQEFGTLSQGEQQKVLIARARMTKPFLIFLDEPCAGMDPGARESFLENLKGIVEHKRIPSLIYVTHHIEEILPLFKKTLILKNGKVLHTGDTNSLLKNNVFRDLYRVSLGITRKRGRYWPISQ